jgi:hypothetical protein
MDEIIGIAVLKGDTLYICTWAPNVQPGGFVDFTSIPVAMNGAQDARKPLWRYCEQGNVLHCRPSVHVQRGDTGQTLFHNAASWQVKFVRAEAGEDALSKCFELNADLAKAKRTAQS